MSLVIKKGATPEKYRKLLITSVDLPIKLFIIEECKSYQVCINDQDINKFATVFELSTDEYYNSLFKMLQNECDSSFVDIVNDKFLLYKNDKIKYFIKELKEVDHVNTLGKCVDHVHNEYTRQTKAVDNLTECNYKLNKEMDALKEKLEECVENATTRENAVYSGFIQLLNEKKRYIQFLKDKLSGNKIPLESSEDNFKNKRPRLDLSDSDSYNTDEEKEQNGKCEKTVASTSSTNVPNRIDDDLDTGAFNSDSDDSTLFLPPRTHVNPEINSQHEKQMNLQEHSIVNVNQTQKEENTESMEITPDTPVNDFCTQDLFDKI